MEQENHQQPIIEPKKEESVPVKPKQFPIKIGIAVLIVVLAMIIVILPLVVLRRSQKNQSSATPTPVPIQPTPTPLRALSAVATQSAFLDFETSTSSLSALIAGYPIFDATLTPPRIELSLGFRL